MKKLLYFCADRLIPFVSWTPLYGHKAMQERASLECSVVQECARQKGFPMITVRWAQWSQKMCGCQMVFGMPNGGMFVDQCQILAILLDWDVGTLLD